MMNNQLLQINHMVKPLLAVLVGIALTLSVPAAAQQQPKLGPDVQTTNPMEIQPTGPKPDWAPTIDPQMLAVIEQLLATEPPGFASMSPFQVRNAVLPAEAALALLVKTGIPPQEPKTDIAHRVLPVGPDEGILVRTYTPIDAGPGPLPVIVYYHGGGWVIADLDTYEPSARALAVKTGAIVVSVAYRQAPQFTFPTAHEDAFAAYRWVTENAAELGGNADRIATAGESAGGNLAVAVAIMARERDVDLPVHILAVYPIADGDVMSPSYEEYNNALPLNRPLMEWFFNNYAPDWQTTEEPLIALIDADLGGLPPTTIVNAEIDPLRYEGEQELTEALREAGVEVEQRTYPGVTHEFFGMAALLEQAVNAQDFAAAQLKSAFGMPMMNHEGDSSSHAMRITQIGVARHAELGSYLTDSQGRAVYLFKADSPGKSTCLEQCAEVWPPVLAEGMPRTADPVVKASMLGSIQRQNGQMQVTYNGWPLYYYVKDSGAGQTTGQDINGFGAEWYLISPVGNEVEKGM